MKGFVRRWFGGFGSIGEAVAKPPKAPSLAIHCETLQELIDYRRRTWGPGWFQNDRFIPSKRGKRTCRWCWP